MRYFIYISDAKVDMILPQVPGAIKTKHAARFGFDIKLLSGSLETERNTLDNKVSRLLVVEEHLDQKEKIGSPNEPAPWIRGSVDAKLVDIGNGAILFLCEGPKWLLALGGSVHHMVGASSAVQVGIPFSHLHTLTDQLTRLVESEPRFLLELPEDHLYRFLASGVDQEFEAWVNVFKWAQTHAKCAPQKIQFLAKRLVTTQTFQGDTVTMGTPLFVALDD